MSEGLTLAKLVRCKRILDANTHPQDLTMFLSLRTLRNYGWTPLEIQNALRSGAVKKPEWFMGLEFIR